MKLGNILFSTILAFTNYTCIGGPHGPRSTCNYMGGGASGPQVYYHE